MSGISGMQASSVRARFGEKTWAVQKGMTGQGAPVSDKPRLRRVRLPTKPT